MFTKRPLQLALIVLGIIVLSSGWMRASQKEKTTWSYKVVQYNPGGLTPLQDAQNLLNEQGAQGWELVSTEPRSREPGITYFYFRKSQ
jgi:hypothetical protein